MTDRSPYDLTFKRVCPVCGEVFELQPLHAYKVNTYVNDKFRCNVPVCSYSCRRKFDREHGNKEFGKLKDINVNGINNFRQRGRNKNGKQNKSRVN